MASGSSVIEGVRGLARGLLGELEAVERDLADGHDKEGLYLRLAAAIDECLAGLAELELWGPENRWLSSELWNVAGRLLSRGWLLNQARTKPRGYAGDYEMLARIYENRLCEDGLGRLLDRYFQAQAAPMAVRHRMAMFGEWFVEAAAADAGPVRIAVVGSAFGLDVRDALVRLDEAERRRVQVTLLDVDPVAIDFARKELLPLIGPEQLTAVSTNLFRLPERPGAAQALRGARLIFCPGIFDYLNDEAARAMLRCLYEQLGPGGRLNVFQFAPHNPTRAYMEWMGNWYLTYRDEAEFRSLVEGAGLAGGSVSYGAERLGVDLFASVSRMR